MDSVSFKTQYLRTALRRWFGRNARAFPWRSENLGTFELTIAEVLLQRTKAETVAGLYPGILRKFPSWKKLAAAKKPQLKSYLKPLGLWRRRSNSLVELAKELTRRGGRLPQDREGIEALPGIGQYIANAILCQVFGRREPFLDVNMARVLERYFKRRKLADLRDDPVLQSHARRILPKFRVKEFNWAVLDFAAAVCRARDPKCESCPLRRHCADFKRRSRQETA